METTIPPSASLCEPDAQASREAPSLKEMLEDGIHLLFLLRSGAPPRDAQDFSRRIDAFLGEYERRAAGSGKSPSAVRDCKYAFCALLDEIILNSELGVRDAWERDPSQLRLFGEHLAGEGFYDRLEDLRLDPQRNLETLEVFYTCLILGFKGRYLLEGEDKLGCLVARLGQEIVSARGGKPGFAPHARPSFRFQECPPQELPWWIFQAFLALVALLVFLAFSFLLRGRVEGLEGLLPPAGLFRA